VLCYIQIVGVMYEVRHYNQALRMLYNSIIISRAQNAIRNISAHHPNSAVLEPRHRVDEIPRTSKRVAHILWLLRSPCERSEFPVTSLRQDCRSRVAFKSPREETLRTFTFRFPRCAADITWGLHLWKGDGGAKADPGRASAPP